MFAIAPAGAYVAQWLQSFRDFPPRQKPGSFNLDRVMEAVTASAKNQITRTMRGSVSHSTSVISGAINTLVAVPNGAWAYSRRTCSV